MILRLALMLVCLTGPVRAETALAAVAANFAIVAEQLAKDYQVISGHQITLTTGATGKLYAQIIQSAPFDLMLSADAAIPAKLHALGHGSPFPYAFGKLMLWAPLAAPDADPAILLETARHIAIANPDLAPYGQAAVQTLEAMGLSDLAAPKLVMGQNIGQTHALVATGAAETGFVAASALNAQGRGLVWAVPQDQYDAIRQDAILLMHGAQNPAAVGFLNYLKSPEARAAIAAAGYGLPE
jgi:molybdate transport system substrate-binding protein